MAKSILDKVIERFLLNAVGSIGRTVGNKLSSAVGDFSDKKKRTRKSASSLEETIRDPNVAPNEEEEINPLKAEIQRASSKEKIK